jgi:hypothetical protein
MAPQTPTDAGPSLRESVYRLIAGMTYFAFLALIFSSATKAPFLGTLLGLLLGAASCTTLALAWLACTALREDGRTGRFGLGSLFLLTTFAAIYFGAVRWVVVNSPRRSGCARVTGWGTS